MDRSRFWLATRRTGTILAVLVGIPLAPSLGLSQDETPTALVTVSPCNVALPPESLDATAFAFRVEETITNDAGRFATIDLCAQTASGWTRLTPCDDVAVSCRSVSFRIEDVAQGESFVATIETP